MAYLNDILGLLNLRENFGLGREQLAQQAKQFQEELGLTREEATRAAQQWQQQFQEAQDRRRFEQQQQQDAVARQMAQQNYSNRWQDYSRGANMPDERQGLLQLLAANRGGAGFGIDQLNSVFSKFGLPGITRQGP